MSRLYRLVLTFVLGVFLPGLLPGQDLSAEQVLDNVENAITASSAEIHLRMELTNAAGSRRERSLVAYAKDSSDRGKSYIRFTAPADIEGTSFLSLEQPGGGEEMYLFMPVLGNVRKIAGSQKSGSFVGTDFTYKDLTMLGGGSYGEDYQASILEQDSGRYVLRLEPVNKDITYQYAKMWVPSANWFPTKVEFYDKDGQLEKILTNTDIEKIDGNWVAREMTMRNVQKGTRTVLHMEEIHYNVPISDQIFTTRNMRRHG